VVQFASHSHAGRVHDDNEDSIGSDISHGLWLVADGMGGHASGEVASAIVRDTLLQQVDLPLTEAVLAAHRAVAEHADSDAGRYRGMGSTVVALALHSGDAEVVWVGDSRAYLWRRDSLQRVSRDHSYVELLRESSAMTEAEVRVHPQRNLVTQTLGHGSPVPGSAHVELRPRDWLMLCSDGLNDELADEEIAALLRGSRAPADAVIQLVDAALAKGGRDNISVVIVAVSNDDLPRHRHRFWQYLRGQVWFPAALGGIGALVLGTLIMLWFKSA
jgi:protein phosphatase